MTDCKSKDTQIAKRQSHSLDMCPKTPQEKERMAKVTYANTIGSLMYAMIFTRLDISYAEELVSRY